MALNAGAVLHAWHSALVHEAGRAHACRCSWLDQGSGCELEPGFRCNAAHQLVWHQDVSDICSGNRRRC